MKKRLHIVAAVLFLVSMVYWVHLLLELDAVGAWTDQEMLVFGTGFLWHLAVILLTVPSVIALGSETLSRALPSGASPPDQRPVVDEWRAVSAIIVLYFALSVLAYPQSMFEYYLTVTLTQLLPLGVAWFICRLNQQASCTPGLRLSVTWSGVFLAALLLALFVVLSKFLGSLIPDFVERTSEQAYKRIAAATLTHYPLHLFVALLAGVAEELIFRGFLLSQIFRRTRSLGTTLLTTSALFGILHLGYGWYYALLTGVFGLCFGVVTIWSRNLFPAILAHIWLNLLAISVIGARMAGYPVPGQG